MVIYKYPISDLGEQMISMPIGAKILTVQTQRNVPQLWALVDPASTIKVRYFLLVGTGQPTKVAQNCNYIGSFQLDEGYLVFHLFEVIK